MTYIDQNIDLQHDRPTFIASKFPPKLTFTFLSVCGTLRPLTCQLLLNKNLFQNPSNQTHASLGGVSDSKFRKSGKSFRRNRNFALSLSGTLVLALKISLIINVSSSFSSLFVENSDFKIFGSVLQISESYIIAQYQISWSGS